MISIWEKTSLLSYDVIIVGAGITGLSTAATIKERLPKVSILVLERGSLPTGASTKNAGFACFGSLSELSHDRKSLGDDGMCALVEKRCRGLTMTRQRLGDEKIGFERCGGYELIREENNQLAGDLAEINQLLASIVGEEVFCLQEPGIADFGFEKVKQIIFNPYEGAIDSGKLISTLWDYCTSLGVRVLTGTSVDQLSQDQNLMLVKTQNFEFQCRALAICTNAFTRQLLTENLDLTPGRGLVTYIKTEKTVPFKGTFHYDRGYFYFRHFGEGLILGGGRNLDYGQEETIEFGINTRILDRLKSDLETMIIPQQRYQIEMTWSGIMAFGKTKGPVVKKIDHNAYLGVRLGGMGIAIASVVAEELASLIIEDHF